VRPDEWEATGPAPDWYDALPRPRLVYAGAIGDRLDVRELERLADAFPDGTVALIGPITSKPIFAALRRRPNVVIAPNQDRDTIRGILAASDVGIMPHVVTPLTLTMSPLKVFEYIAAGIPAVATDLPPVRDLHDRIASVPVGGDFVGAVRAALARGRVLDEERQRLFREHCWHGRFEALLAVALREPGGG
jgi:glycosyltransferase involved in cell wall biosynthesis